MKQYQYRGTHKYLNEKIGTIKYELQHDMVEFIPNGETLDDNGKPQLLDSYRVRSENLTELADEQPN